MTASWHANAACRDKPVEMFYPVMPLDERASLAKPTYERAVAEAKAVCRRCPVADECLEAALVCREEGVWGGLTEDERARVGSTSRRRRKALTDRVRRERLKRETPGTTEHARIELRGRRIHAELVERMAREVAAGG